MELRCYKCQRLLGKRIDGRIEIKRKDLLLYVTGTAFVYCPKCGTTHSFDS